MDFNCSFKSAQSQFYKWTKNWTINGENSENIQNSTPDLLDLITIFQILGFTVGHVDVRDPHDISKLSCGEKGLKIIISCGHSGVRFALEGVNVCSCSQKLVDSVHKIMLYPEHEQRKETYSKIRLLDVADGEKLVIQTVLAHLVHMIHAVATNNDQNQNMEEATKDNEENQNMIEEIKIQGKTEMLVDDVFTPSVPTEEKEKSSDVVMSPGRYRSLDTLIGKKLLPDELSEPGHLCKKEDAIEKKSIPVVICSSPNLSIPLKPSNTSSPVANIAILRQGYTKLLSVQELVKDVLDIFEKSQEIPKFSFDVSNIKASTESLCIKKTTLKNFSSDSSLVVKRNIKPLCRPSIRSATSIKSTAASTSTNTLPKPTTGRKSSENVSPTFKTNNKPSTVSSATKSQKFAHVKSTIPKGNTSKK